MNIQLMAQLNHYSLFLSKCFYKINFFLPGRLIAKIRQNRTLKFLEKDSILLLNKKYTFKNLERAENYVFIMWYQGFDSLPPVIEKCIASIKKHIKNKKIIYISRQNISEYIDLPQFIYNKVDKNLISKTHFSDIIRVALLDKYGGTWIDAACFITKDIDNSYFEKLFYSPAGIKSEIKKDFRYLFQGSPGWNISFQGTNVKHFPIYDFLYSYYITYFSKYNMIIDYFQTDFLISLFYKHNSEFRVIINNQELNNINEFELALLMNKPCNKSTMIKYKAIENTFINKLTYKKNWDLSATSNKFSGYFFNNY